MEGYEFVENDDFITVTKNLVGGGKASEHLLKIDMAKELAMVENNKQGKIK
ncbi:hypothetical protein CQZ91_21645 [Bacillus cereus]|uniref:antA/AntB antirepressor family protein n=1 Tax=Bacillus cereus TaxID=1396 RepID=UPI000CFBEA4B|nr:hypothetical protein CQZ92_21480 [Bacillus cereus]PRD02479.1 hypothetical protein CQZ91_21645 [Bacillus cereus]